MWQEEWDGSITKGGQEEWDGPIKKWGQEEKKKRKMNIFCEWTKKRNKWTYFMY